MTATAAVADPRRLADAVARAQAHSPFLRLAMRRRPDVVDALMRDGLDTVVGKAREASLAADDVKRALREERLVVALAVALADLAGAALETVMTTLSDFADYALDRALAAVFAMRMPGVPMKGMVALALGKQGSRELNYSSDIDPILLFDPQSLPHSAREEPVEAAVRIARALVSILQEPTGDGYVLRVDLRLRPASEATPLAVPIVMAIAHYESSALPWERAAFIRARPAAGDLALGRHFLEHIRPFVWRRSLDFGAIRELRALSRGIRDHHAQGQIVGPGYDVKRGRGGIREIEFFAQIHQLIHGGRDASLRAPATLDALAALADHGRIDDVEARDLGEIYRLLRTIEHRLQMVEDRQTHSLPRDAAALDNVAHLAACEDGAALVAMLLPKVARVGLIYDGLDPSPVEELAASPASLIELLKARGFEDAAALTARIEAWRAGAVRTTRSPAAREALEAVLPSLIDALAAAPSPDVAFRRFDDLVTQLPSALNLFRMLEARPQLFGLLAAILSHALPLAAELGRRADLLDGLIDASALAPVPSLPALIATLAGEGRDYQDLLDRVRLGVSERRFALGVQLVAGARDPIAVGQDYSRVAEAAIEVLAQGTVAEFEAAHGRVPGSELLVLALGRLGGGVLTNASDLDLIYLFSGDFLAESDGKRPLGATTYFNRLAQRVTAALSVPTASGPLYAVDTRLRPSGGQGLLAVSLDSFERYEREDAWTWEHMALTRARPVFGSPEGRRALQSVIDAALARPRDPLAITGDAAKMRSDVARHKPPAGLFDVKLAEGGLIDAEFAIHLLQLREGVGIGPDLAEASGALEVAGLLDAGFGDATALLQRMLIVLRLVAPDGAEPPGSAHLLVAQACGTSDWATLLDLYAAARVLISKEWRRVAGLG